MTSRSGGEQQQRNKVESNSTRNSDVPEIDPINRRQFNFGVNPEFRESLSNSARRPFESNFRDLKDQFGRESDMFFEPNNTGWDNIFSKKADEDGEWGRRDVDEMSSRHPMFRMPNWMSEDDDVSNLASRMSQTPHWSTRNRRDGPWDERCNYRGQDMSGPSGNITDKAPHCSGGTSRPDAMTHSIPIRIEAEAPPGYEPVPRFEPYHQPVRQNNDDPTCKLPDGIDPHMSVENQAQYASKTAPLVDRVSREDVPRDARSSSAPPDVTDQGQGNQRYVTKINITPQTSSGRHEPPKFNNVAKPFTTQEMPAPIAEEEQFSDNNVMKGNIPQQTRDQLGSYSEEEKQFHQPQPQQSYQPVAPQFHQQFPNSQHQQYSDSPHNVQQAPHQQVPLNQKGGVIRNIPIFVEGRDESGPDRFSTRSAKNTSQQSQAPSHNNYYPMPHQSQVPPTQHWQHNFPTPPLGFSQPSHSNYYPMQEQFYGQPMPQYQQTQNQYDFPQQNPTQPAQHQQMPSHQFQEQKIPTQHPHPQIPTEQPHPEHAQPQQSHFHGSPPRPTTNHPSVPQAEITPQVPHEKEPTFEPTIPPVDMKMTKIQDVRSTFSEYQEKVNNFDGKGKNKEYLYLDEMLTRLLLQLDNIDPDGRDDVRQARKLLIKDINYNIGTLEKKACDNANADTVQTKEDPSDHCSEQQESNKPKESISQDAANGDNYTTDTKTAEVTCITDASKEKSNGSSVGDIGPSDITS